MNPSSMQIYQRLYMKIALHYRNERNKNMQNSFYYFFLSNAFKNL